MLITVKGYICELQDDRFVMVMHNSESTRNIIFSYTNMDFVPLVGKDKVKVKYGFANTRSKIMKIPVIDFMTQFLNLNVEVSAVIKKNKFANNGNPSQSLSLIAKSITAIDKCTASGGFGETVLLDHEISQLI